MSNPKENPINNIRKLAAHEIEVRIGATNKEKAKAQLLLYKDARCDMAILDEVFGVGNWQANYCEIAGMLFCAIGVLFGENWVWKQSNGIESQGMGDEDPNNKKGWASDAFKRAGFMWGIGRELYEWKGIWIDYDRTKYARYEVAEISYTDKGAPKSIKIVDQNGKIVYKFDNGRVQKAEKQTESKSSDDTILDVTETKENAPRANSEPVVADTAQVEKQIVGKNKLIFEKMIRFAFDVCTSIDQDADKDIAKSLATNYIISYLKIPMKTIELVDALQKPTLLGRVVVAMDKDGYADFEQYIRESMDTADLF